MSFIFDYHFNMLDSFCMLHHYAGGWKRVFMSESVTDSFKMLIQSGMKQVAVFMSESLNYSLNWFV